MLAGRPHEAVGNGSPRWMAAGPRKRVHRTRPTGQLTRRPLICEKCAEAILSVDSHAVYDRLSPALVIALWPETEAAVKRHEYECLAL